MSARRNREQNPPPLNLEGVESVLYMTMAYILETTDYVGAANCSLCAVARLLATMLATLEDQKRH